MKRIAIIFSITCLAAGIASAQNLLVNGDFNTPNNAGPNPAPAPWATWTWPDWNGAWANQQNDASAFDGSSLYGSRQLEWSELFHWVLRDSRRRLRERILHVYRLTAARSPGGGPKARCG